MIWMIIGIILLLALLTLVLLNRSKVSTKNKTDKDLALYKTYAFLPSSTITISEKPKKELNDVSERVIAEVNKSMQRAGYLLDLNLPELLVMLQANKVVPPPIYASYPYATVLPMSPFYAPYSYAGYAQYTKINNHKNGGTELLKGSLSVLIIERRSKNILWEGTASESIFNVNSDSEIIEYIQLIFEAYPTIKSKSDEH